jgi:hypothetical protein
MTLLTLFGGSHYTPLESYLEERTGLVAFGGMDIDLTRARLAPGDHELELIVLFGGAEIRVPDDMAVRLDGIALFGGMSDRRPVPFDQSPARLTVRVMCAFGGVNVKRVSASGQLVDDATADSSTEDRPMLEHAQDAPATYDGPTTRLEAGRAAE